MTIRQTLVAVLSCVAVLSAPTSSVWAQAQTVTLPPNPTVIHATNTVTVGGAFSVTIGSVTQNSLQANPCNPGACFDAITTVHANQRWQLQVTLAQTSDVIVYWIEQPGNIVHPLAAGVPQTIATGAAATPAQQLSSMYNANKTTGKGGFVPTAAQLAAVLTYSVIASP
jgi:hypothetical protein